MLKFAYSILKHKFYVFWAGLFYTKANLYDLIIHDFSKFSLTEFIPYYQKFGKKSDSNEIGFAHAWLHHQNVNPHHWEYWIGRSGHALEEKGFQTEYMYEMPERYVREMVADWLAADRTYNKTGKWVDLHNWNWMNTRGRELFKSRLHPNTIECVDKVFAEVNKRLYGTYEMGIFKSYLK